VIENYAEIGLDKSLPRGHTKAGLQTQNFQKKIKKI
jgi:hypothetical protein